MEKSIARAISGLALILTGILISACTKPGQQGLYPLKTWNSIYNLSKGDVEELLETKKCQECSLQNADLNGAYLAGADLREADLRGANLGGANLKGADLRGANLRETYFGKANLNGAILDDAHISGARFQNADVTNVDFSKANIYSYITGGSIPRFNNAKGMKDFNPKIATKTESWRKYNQSSSMVDMLLKFEGTEYWLKLYERASPENLHYYAKNKK